MNGIMQRREFLRRLAGLTAGAGVAGWGQAQEPPGADRLGPVLPRRPLGATGESVTLLCLGGWHVGNATEAEAPAVVEAALEEGIRFFDTAWQYQQGRSEERYGKHLIPKYRDDVFLMTKVVDASRSGAQRQFETSLRRLKTDRVDLLLMHGVSSPRDVDRRLDSGVLEVMLEAREKGQARYLGVSSHSRPSALTHIIERLGADNPLSVCLAPMNPVDASREDSFIRKVIPAALARNMAPLAMKSLAFGHFFAANSGDRYRNPDPVIPNYLSVEEALWFALSLPVASLLSGMDTAARVRENVSIVRRARELSEADRGVLIDKVSALAGNTQLEWYRG